MIATLLILPITLQTAKPESLQASLFGATLPIKAIKFEKMPNRALAKSSGKKDEADIYIISFQGSKTFMPEKQIVFHLYVNPGTNFGKFSLNQPALKFGTPEYSRMIHGTKEVSCGRGVIGAFIDSDGHGEKARHESASDMIGFKFTSKKLANGKYLGSIYAVVSGYKTGVKGQFEFVPTKYGNF